MIEYLSAAYSAGFVSEERITRVLTVTVGTYNFIGKQDSLF